MGRAIGNAQLRRARSCSCARARCALATIEPCAHRSVCRAAARRSRREVARSDRAPPCVFFCCLCYSLNPLNFTYSSWLLSFLLLPSFSPSCGRKALSVGRVLGWMDGWVGACVRVCARGCVHGCVRSCLRWLLSPPPLSLAPSPFSFFRSLPLSLLPALPP